MAEFPCLVYCNTLFFLIFVVFYNKITVYSFTGLGFRFLLSIDLVLSRLVPRRLNLKTPYQRLSFYSHSAAIEKCLYKMLTQAFSKQYFFNFVKTVNGTFCGGWIVGFAFSDNLIVYFLSALPHSMKCCHIVLISYCPWFYCVNSQDINLLAWI